MGRICPILNHPLKDGVLVDDDVLVKFIQKRNTDFLPNELVCRWCKGEVIKLYTKKMKKAIELKKQKSRLHEGSMSSLKTSKSSNGSTASDTYSRRIESLQRVQLLGAPNGLNRSNTPSLSDFNGNAIVTNNQKDNSNKTINIQMAEILSVSERSIVLSTSISNAHSILQENQNNQQTNEKTSEEIITNAPHVTLRKRTVRDYLTVKAPAPAQFTEVTTSHTTADDDEDMRRLSQEPTTSKAANTKKRSWSAVIDSDSDDDAASRSSEGATRSTVINTNKRPLVDAVDIDDDDSERLSLNAINGTPLPHIQPIPAKRKAKQVAQKTMAQDIMGNYIKNINGG